MKRITEVDVPNIDSLLGLISWAHRNEHEIDPSEYLYRPNWGRYKEEVVWGPGGVAVYDPVDGYWQWAENRSAWRGDARRYYTPAYRRMFP